MRPAVRSLSLLCVAVVLGCARAPAPGSVPAPGPASAGAGKLVPASAFLDPLPTWNAGNSKQAILNFVGQITDPGNSRYVPPEERVAVFDNDGTLWAEKPIYFQVLFMFDRVHALAEKHPEWKTRQPFKAVLERDHATMAKFGKHELFALFAATGAGVSTEEFERAARVWLEASLHPELGRPFTELVYQPMLDLMALLRRNAFQIFIVTGGDVDFVRAFSRELYGVPPDRVVGSSLKYGFRETPRGPVVERLAEPGTLNDGPAKPENIELHIGVRPIVAVGNSDGDLQMLEYAQAGARPALLLLVHHDDAEREFAYDRASSVGRLDEALDAALRRGWAVISMRRDFRIVFPPSTDLPPRGGRP
jgi:phosphoserine phosphatase